MKKYSFVTIWKLKGATLEEVWKTIKNAEEWPSWWKGVIRVKTLKMGNADDVGKISLFTFKSFLPYSLTFTSKVTRITLYKTMAGETAGELEGTGVWVFSEEGDVIRVQYNWEVKTTKAWMNALDVILRPAFEWNHNIIMHRGLKGIAKKLHGEIVK